MINRRNLSLALVGILILVIVVGSFFNSDEDSFTIEAMDIQRPNHLDLLFQSHGGVTYRHYGSSVSMYLVQYRRDEQVFHELVTGIARADAYAFSGSAIWGVTREGMKPHELRASVTINGSMGQSYIDLSALDFDFSAIATSAALVDNQRIESGERYVLHIWQSGGGFRADGNVFAPEQLRESEHTLILYLIFD